MMTISRKAGIPGAWSDATNTLSSALFSPDAPLITGTGAREIEAHGSLAIQCFVAGTRISAERGEVPVEELRVGDRVQVVHTLAHPDPPARRRRGSATSVGPRRGPAPRSGGESGAGPIHASQPIVWLGHRTVDCASHPEPLKVWPVCVSANALGPGRPSHDLWLSPDHALYVADVLIPVKHLVNGITIRQLPCDEVTYHHVELTRHSVLLAEGLPAESYLDAGDRSSFENSGGPVARHPTRCQIVGSPRLRAPHRHRRAACGRTALGECLGLTLLDAPAQARDEQGGGAIAPPQRFSALLLGDLRVKPFFAGLTVCATAQYSAGTR